MNSAPWLPSLAIAALVIVAAVLVWRVRGERQRARDAAPMAAGVAAAKVELRELERRYGAGEVDAASFMAEQESVVSALLEAQSPAAVPAQSRPALPYTVATLTLALVAAAAVHFWAGGNLERGRTAAAASPAVTQPASGSEGAPPLHALSDQQLQRMVDEAGAKVRQAPDDAAAWAMLAHSYDMLGKFAESSKAYATLARLLPNDAQVLADYADALAVANGRSLAGEPTELVKKAIAIDARNIKALALAGTAAYERADYPQAVAFWERSLAAGPDPAFRQQIEASLLAARTAQDGGAASGVAAMATKASSADRGAAGIAVVSGRVTLADDLVAKAAPDATVYIFARPAEGSRMPVALMRRKVRDLPAEFSLDDSNAMVPDVRLSQVATVVIGARVSKRGDVTPEPGDMQGWSAPVRVGTRGIRLEISEVLK